MEEPPFDLTPGGRSFAFVVDADLAAAGPALDAAAAGLEVSAFTGEEALSEPFHYTVELATAAPVDAILHELLGKSAALVLRTAGPHPREIRGVVRAAEARGTGAAGSSRPHRLAVELVPHLSLLAETRNCRIFQDRTAADIVRSILDAWGLPHRTALLRRYDPWPYCVQHHESDLDFVLRLLASEGIFFFFETPSPTAPGERVAPATLVLADGPTAYASFGPPGAAAAFDTVLPTASHGSALGRHAEAISRIGRRVALAPRSVAMRDYHPTSALLDVTAAARTAGDPPAGLDVHEYLPPAPLGANRQDLAAAALAQHRRAAERVDGASDSPRLVPGHGFLVLDPPEASLGGAFAITRLRARGAVAHHAAAASPVTATSDVYENTFEAVTADMIVRPPRPAWQPRDVLDTAVVVGPDGEGSTLGDEVYTDVLGRVHVRFRWGLGRPRLDAVSCWIRAVQPWAGPGFGAHFTPRIGMEVIVGFLGGDAARPVILGCVPNSSNLPPFRLPAEQTRSGVVTRSSPGGGGQNELTFDDAAGRERVALRAEKDHDVLVLQDQTVDVRRDARAVVHRDAVSEVKRHRADTIEGDASLAIHGRSVEHVAGERVRRAGGPTTDTHEADSRTEVRGDAERVVRGALRDRVEGRASSTFAAETIARHEAGATTIVGTPAAPAPLLLHVEGDAVIQSRRTVEITSDTALRLVCGDSVVLVTPDCIQLTSKKIRLEGDALESTGGSLNMKASEAARIEAKKVFALSSGASLALTADAKLDGGKVKLKAPPDATDGPEAKKAAPPATRIRLTDQDGAPVAGARFVITRADGSRRGGVTGAGGEASVPGLEGEVDIAFPDLSAWEEG